MDNKKFVVAIFLTILVSMIVFLEFNRAQMKAMYKNANAITSNLDNRLQNTVKDVEFLHLAAVNKMQERKMLPLQNALLIKKIDKKSNYALDGCDGASISLHDKVNLLGYSDSTSYKKYLHEMQAALNLEAYMKLIYKKNKHYAWVYYFSKHHFTVLFPYVSSKNFDFKLSLEQADFYLLGTPKINPDAKIFFTPLYMDKIGKGLMITIGKPLYCQKEYFGVINIDITLNSLDNTLSQLDSFNNCSIVYNKQNQVVASHNIIKNFDRSKIYKIDKIVPDDILHVVDTYKNFKYVHSKYIFTKTLSCGNFKFLYTVNAYTLWLKSFIYTLPIFLLMLFSIYLVYAYKKSKKLNHKLQLQNIEDYMTGMYNRRYFFKVAEAFFLKAKRKNSKLAIIMMDIDDFKNINDTYGHDIGDIAIMEVKNIFDENLRHYDLYARFGGEEFCLLLDDISKEDVIKLFEKMRKKFENNIIKKGSVELKYTVSFGIYYGLLDSLESMIKEADEAVYKSKTAGKNRVTFCE